MIDVWIIDDKKMLTTVTLPESVTKESVQQCMFKTTKNDGNQFVFINCDKQGQYKLHIINVKIETANSKLVISYLQNKNQEMVSENITNLDYFEHMMDKFGGYGECYQNNETLNMNTIFIIKDINVTKYNQSEINQKCQNIPQFTQDLVCEATKKNFKNLNWNAVMVDLNEKWLVMLDVKNNNKTNENININNMQPQLLNQVIYNLIVALPIQIARGAHKEFTVMFNGIDNQEKYNACKDFRQLQKKIRFAAYDALIGIFDFFFFVFFYCCIIYLQMLICEMCVKETGQIPSKL